jgi:hypothetical protein
MLIQRKNTLAAAICGLALLMAGPVFAQSTASPFGKATPQQEKQAKEKETGRLNAIKQWENLPQQQKDRIASQLASLNAQQRIELLTSLPSFKNLSPEQLQVILDKVVHDVPLPSPYKFTLSFDPTTPPPIAIGSEAYLTLYVERVLTPEYVYPYTFQIFNAANPGTPLPFPWGTDISKCAPATKGNEIGDVVVTPCSAWFTPTSPNPAIFFQITFRDQSGNNTIVRTQNFVIPTQ